MLQVNRIIASLILSAMMMGSYVLTGSLVARKVREETTHQLRGEFQAYLDQQRQESEAATEKGRAASFLTGEASRQAAIDSLTDSLKRFIGAYRMDGRVTTEGAYTIGWCPVARLIQGGYGSTIEDVLGGAKQWEFYTPNHAYRAEDEAIAREIATAYVDGVYPDDFTGDLIYAERNADGSVTLRNEFKTTSRTKFWRYKI